MTMTKAFLNSSFNLEMSVILLFFALNNITKFKSDHGWESDMES